MSAYFYDGCLMMCVCTAVRCLNCMMYIDQYDVCLLVQCHSACMVAAQPHVCKPRLYYVLFHIYFVCFTVMSAYLSYVFLPAVSLHNCMMSAYLYVVCSTVCCLPACMMSV